MLQITRSVKEAKQQRSDGGAGAIFVPAEAGDDAIAFARMLDLQHDPLVGFVSAGRRLCDDAVETGPLEPLEPVRGDRPVACRRRQMKRRLHTSHERLESAPPLLERRIAQIAIPSDSRSKQTKDAGISLDSISTREAAG